MAGYNNQRQDTTNIENGADFLDNLLEEMDSDEAEEELLSAQKKRAEKQGEFLRKIELLREQQTLKDNLSDYDWYDD